MTRPADGVDFTDAFETDVAVRYAELDTYGHLNNAAYAALIEEARIDYLERVLPDPASVISERADGPGLVVAGLELDFRSPVRERGPVTVAVVATAIGESSLTVASQVRADGEVTAVAETSLVAYDRERGAARPLPQSWREAIEAFEPS